MRRRVPEGWQPKVVALDIDGTLFTAGHGVASNTVDETVSPAVRSAIDQRGVEPSVYVVDNGSTVPAVADPRVTVEQRDENLGVGGGRNVGARLGDAPFVCFLDSDARLHDGALAALLAPMLEDASIGLTAPVFTGQRPEASGGRAPTLRRKAARLQHEKAVGRVHFIVPRRCNEMLGITDDGLAQIAAQRPAVAQRSMQAFDLTRPK